MSPDLELDDVSAGAFGPVSLDAFLAGIERRALRMAQIALDDREAALDVVQDAMLQLVRRYAARPAAEWSPLFWRCLQNRVRDARRRQWLRQRLFFRATPAFVDDAAAPGGAPDPLLHHADPVAVDGIERVQRDEAMRHLARALRALPTRQREAFELRVWEGLDVRDTAMAMGCSEGSVKTHLSRALASLRHQLQGVWP